VASYSIAIEHHFGMGDSAWCKAMSCLAVRVSLTVAKKDFMARALSTANACNLFLGLILRTVNSSLPTFFPSVLVYVKCSLRYHRPPTPCLTENFTSQAEISRRTTTIMQPLLGQVSRLSNSF